MSSDLERFFRTSLKDQLRLESYLSLKLAKLSETGGGVRDIDLALGLAICKFTIVLTILEKLQPQETPSQRREFFATAKEKTLEGAELLDDLIDPYLPVEQSERIRAKNSYGEARELLKKVLLLGGGAFFEEEDPDMRSRRLLAYYITAALKKYARPDDAYPPFFRTENLPEPLRSLVGTLFPILAPADMPEIPYGIADDESEEVLHSDRMKLPLRQAIHYYEQELIPSLEFELQQNPGETEIQEHIAQIRAMVAEYKQLVFIPRSTPIVAPHGFYTESLTEYTAEGELLVPVNLKVSWRSGTQIDRYREQVLDEVTRLLAGRGLCPVLDQELYQLKQLESGHSGSTLFPKSKLNTKRGFKELKKRYPGLAVLEDRDQLKLLLQQAQTDTRRHLQRSVRVSLFGGEADRLLNP